jgi:toxin YoeB
MSYKLDFTKEAFAQLEKLKRSDKQSYTKCFELILAIMTEPRAGIGKPEQLRYQKEEVWSRRISEKDRLVYTIFEEDELAIIQSVLGHYNDH